MTKRPVTKKQRVLDFAASRGWTLVEEAEWRELRAALPDVSESTIRGAGLQISAPWCGIHQHTLEELEQSLHEFADVYASREDLRRYCRDEVIAAKDHARWASRSPRVDEARRVLKAEMVDWMLVWLDDPAMFQTWAAIRRDKIGGCSST
jgi:hypothetical protein